MSLSHNTTLDDLSSALTFTGPWHSYSDSTAGWYDDSLMYCGGAATPSTSSEPCEMRLTTNATWFGVFGHTNASSGVFDCRLQYDLANGTAVAPLPWVWYDAAHTNGYRSNPITLCSVYNLPPEVYTLVLTVQPGEVSKGVGIDFVTYLSQTEVPGGPNWFSNLNTAVPPTNLRDTTHSPMLPPSTSASSPTASASLSSGHSNPTGVGLGVGLAALVVILAVLVAWFVLRRKRRRAAAQSDTSSRTGSLHSLQWLPDMHSLRSTIDSPATGSSTCLWLGRPDHLVGLSAKDDSHNASESRSSDFTIVPSSESPFDDRYAASEAPTAGTYGSDFDHASVSSTSRVMPPAVVITPASDAGTLVPSPFDDDAAVPIAVPSTLSRRVLELEEIDLDAPLEHPDSFRPRY